MNIRVRFRKFGTLKFIGHLDVMRYFQKAIRRAGIDICYSEGFSPHMVMSFASPLGVGLTSDGEYMDIRVHSAPSSREAVRRLNEAMVDGLEAISFRRLPKEGKNAMSAVAAADYEVRFREGFGPDSGWQEALLAFLGLDEIRVVKKTKKGSAEVDIRPWIYSCTAGENAVFMRLSAGSVHNLKPELFMQAFADYAGFTFPSYGLLIHRKELYADQEEDGGQKLISLEALGEEIE